VQLGNVTLVQEPAAKDGGPPPTATTATAGQASYDAATQVVQLTGNPRVHDGGGDLAASFIEVDRTTGNGNARGGVKATYRQASGQQNATFTGTGPVHVVADHAHLDHRADLTTFYGTPESQARLFQGSDSVSAPVLELSQSHATLAAHGPPGDAAAVNAVFTNASSNPKTPPSVVRLQSRTLLYADKEHKAVFSGNVVAQTSSGVLHASSMDIYFSPTSAAQTPGRAPQSSQLSKIVARGAVEIQQPGRKGSGEELEYTAQDGKFVLTGSAGAPPRLTDQVRGTVTGSALIFNDRDDSVMVSGGPSKAVTQTHVAK
jgi:lipopolysaccharide export system protein LptA